MAAPQSAAVAPHPRIWLTPALLGQLKQRALTNQGHWTQFKRNIDIALIYCQTGRLKDFSQSTNLALGYSLGAAMTPAERAATGMQSYEGYGRCAVELAKTELSDINQNRIIVHRGDGKNKSFPLGNPIYSSPYRIDVNVGGQITTYFAGKIGLRGVEQGMDWYWENGGQQIHQAETGVPLTANDTITILYDGEPMACKAGETQTALNDGTYVVDDAKQGVRQTPYIRCTFASSDKAEYSFATMLNDFRNYAARLAAVFDWAHPMFTPGERKWMVDSLRSAAWYQVKSDQNRWNPYNLDNGQGPGGNYGSGQISRVAIIGIATHGDNPSDSGMTNDEINWAMGWFRAYAKPHFNGGVYPDLTACAWCPPDTLRTARPGFNPAGMGIGGAPVEGPGYGALTAQYYLEMARAFETSGAGNINIFQEIPNYASDLLNYMVHSTSPTPYEGSYVTYNFGDAENGQKQGFSEWYALCAFHLSEHFGESDKGRYIRRWFDRTQPSGPPYVYFHGFYFMYRMPNWSTADYGNSLDPDYLARGMGVLFSRSGWQDDATWFGFQSGSRWNNHQHADVHNFAIFRKGQWLSQEDHGYDSTVFGTHDVHSTLTYLKEGENLIKGPVHFKALGAAEVVKHKADSRAGYVYLRSDATEGYQAKMYAISGTREDFLNMRHYTRDVVYFKPDLWVFVDRVRYAGPTRSFFHLMGFPTPDGIRPLVNGNTVTLPVYNQKLVMTALAPHKASFEVIDTSQPRSVVKNNSHDTNVAGIVALNGADASDTSIPFHPVRMDGFTVPTMVAIGGEKVQVCRVFRTNAPLNIVSVVVGPGGVIEATTESAHSLQDGDYVQIDEVQGVPAANGIGKIVRRTGTVFTLTGKTGSGQYAGGGVVSFRNNMRICGGGRGAYGTRPMPLAPGVPISGYHRSWQIKSGSTAPAAGEEMIHVLQAADAAAAVGAPSLLDSVGAGYHGVLVTGLNQPHVALMPKDPIPMIGCSFSASYAGSARILVTGLAAGRYVVARQGSPLAGYEAVMVDDSGSLYFEAPAGSFTVTRF